ncbi:polyprenyl synthetase family protein [Chondrinema litorale]|uniref:polyprenyl synthetase family protein n=1 Tax=Chondrinema litorale TaxID=2994555 RepID=UPI0025439FD5|nr:polyprenyl synthetase family protein [Chondrinema litorale]UZR95169.1 polyprenyl synthetase family protein [Chondrinema litorale]
MPFQYTSVQNKIEESLQQLPLSGKPVELYEPIRYILNVGGKRLRPLLTTLGCYLFNEQFDKALKPALAVEVFHNFTLMHDDIMDQAPLRRGKPTVHEKWSANVAILSGDVMLVKAYNLLLNVDKDIIHKVIEKFNKCACEVCEGQQFDMNFETLESVSIESYLNMIRLKTAVLLGFSLELGAILGGAEEHAATQLKNFGESIGLGFQIKDDLLDVYGNQQKFGKQVGGDIIANKKTYLLLKALKDADKNQLTELNSWLAKEEFNPEDKVNAVKAIYDELNIREKAQELAENYFTNSFKILEQLNIHSERKNELINFADMLIHREK